MPFISQFVCLTLLATTPTQPPTAPTIEKLVRSERTDGVWHDVMVSYRGKKKQKLRLNVRWEAKTPAENGQGTMNFKSTQVSTDAKGLGRWKLQVKGYPAGKMRASVTDAAGRTSKPSPVFNVPWLY
jgi:hypothetical protein